MTECLQASVCEKGLVDFRGGVWSRQWSQPEALVAFPSQSMLMQALVIIYTCFQCIALRLSTDQVYLLLQGLVKVLCKLPVGNLEAKLMYVCILYAELLQM